MRALPIGLALTASGLLACSAAESTRDGGLGRDPADVAGGVARDVGTQDGALDAAQAGPDTGLAGPDVDTAPDAAVGDGGRPWAPCDVSILWPVAPVGTLPPGYLRLEPNALDPVLPLPAEARAIFPDLHGDVPGGGIWAAVVIALRVDPCAASDTGACVRELRLSAETLAPGLDDAAIHLIYELDEPSFTALLEDLWALKARSPVSTDGPLGPHPGLASAGIDSDYTRSLHALVLEHATPTRLVRLTFNTFAFDNWGFSRFERTSSGWARTDIPRLPTGTNSQAWLRQGQQDDLDDPSGTIDPSPADNFATLLRRDALAGGTTTREVLAARDVINQLEDPARTNAAITDCVSCHMAGPAHLWAAARGVDFDTAARYRPPVGLSLDRPRPPELEGNLSNTIAFGYHRVTHSTAYPSVSARVAAETLEVVAALRSRR